MTAINDILSTEGIVIRLIPKESTGMYNYNEHNKILLHKPNTQLVWCPNREREMIRETRQNSFGGKYLVTKANNQDGLVRFNFKTCGVGDTIEEAYENYLNIVK